MADWTIKQHDTYPPLEAILSDQDGVIDLTLAASVKLILKTTSGSPMLLTCSIVSAAAGHVLYDWQAADTSTVNTYQGEFEITWTNGDITTVPNDKYFSVEVKADLG